MNNSIENLININPKDYSWEYKRFKKAQPKNIDPYLKAHKVNILDRKSVV